MKALGIAKRRTRSQECLPAHVRLSNDCYDSRPPKHVTEDLRLTFRICATWATYHVLIIERRLVVSP